MMSSNGTRKRPNWRLRELRINAGLSPNELGYRAGISGKAVRAIEDGTVRRPRPRTQFAIAEVFGLLPLDVFPLETHPLAGRDRTRV